jgi:hypothetical protein
LAGSTFRKTIEHRTDEDEPAKPPKPPKPPKREPPPPAKQESDDGADPAVGEALQRGYDARKAFPDLLRDAIPPEYRTDEELADAWREGFDRAGAVNEPPEDPSFDGAILERFEKRAADSNHEDDLALAWSDLVQPHFRKLEKAAQQKAHEVYQNRRAALRGG